MVQTERNQCSFHQTIQECSEVTGVTDKSTDSVDTILNCRPDEEHQNTDKQIYDCRNNRNKSCTTEEGQYLWQFNAIVLIV